MSNDILVSIIICTHRRPDSLESALQSLVQEKWKGNDWEVLVIENDREPSAEVAEVLSRFAADLPLSCHLETIPNLSRARNLGAEKALGEYLAYIDDDVEVVPGWMNALFTGCREYHPDFLTGPSYPLYRSPKPYWYLDEWATACYHGDELKQVAEIPAGMNFIVKREIVLQLKGFRENLGMAGGKLAYGEETDIVCRTREARPDSITIYIPDLAVRHEIRSAKMTIRWNIRSAWASGRDGFYLGMNSHLTDSWPHIVKTTIRSVAFLIVRTPKALILAAADLFRPGRSIWRRYVKRHMGPEVIKLSVGVHATLSRLRGSK